MLKKDIRRHHRIPYVGRVRISWEAAGGVPKYALATSIDVSEGGLLVEVSEPIAAYTNVSVQADRINLAGSAVVKHVGRHGSKYILGLELSQALRDRTLSLVREGWTFSKPVSVA